VRHAARLAVVLALLPAAAGAQVYKWTDSTGKTQYGDRPPEEARAQSLKVDPQVGANPFKLDTPSGAVGREAGVEVAETEIVWFRVAGLTVRDLHASKEVNGPFNDIAEARVWGQCGWRLRWKYTNDRSQGDCRIGEFTVTLSARVWLPKWDDYNRAGPELRAKWDTFYKRLVTHEDGHKANGVRAANDLARRMRAMRPYATCDGLNLAIQQQDARISSEYRLVDRAFDRVERIYAEGLR
jgi:predicted secreted Zn-dependent protease